MASAQTASITLNPSTVEVGASFTATLTGFVCNNDVGPEDTGLIVIRNQNNEGIVFEPFLQDAAGSAVETLTAPSTPGTYVVFADFDDGRCQEGQTTLTVIPVASTPPSTAEETTTTTTTIAGQVAPTTAAATTTAAPATLPATGRATDGLVWLALAVSLLGGGLVAVAARRS
ncbi:MAG TPA: LPXTG cell wall anchor domain-containing protein [Ilumatobacteraceae bacterium]|nr:LPXTG cell wall anchor domain-containing protein [Ilumatobacteraceae bacterium]